MTPEQSKSFDTELQALLAKYNVDIVPSLGLRLQNRPEPKVEEAKVKEVETPK